MLHAQEIGSYAQGQGSLAVFKFTARDQGHYKGFSGAFVTYCNISCYFFFFFVLSKNTFLDFYMIIPVTAVSFVNS